jgi:dTDP-4-dehydrorhamnose 3,5-epimerase
MECSTFEIAGLILIKPKVFSDNRGSFLETFHIDKYREIGIDKAFVQDNESVSSAMVLRGLHFQCPPFAQGKLIRVISGSIYDVAVDIRKNSPTYGRWHAEILTGENRHQFWIPEGFAHGFLALEDQTIVNYKCTSVYQAGSEATLLWNDPDIGIHWPGTPVEISPKDLGGESFSHFCSPFDSICL